MKHLVLHCQTKPPIKVPLRKVSQCSKCFLGFSTPALLRGHSVEAHTLPKNETCEICDKVFENKIQFLYHMHRTHVALELPYKCQLCGFMCSLYTDFTKHIVEVSITY